jgi:hypothetical protein
MSDSSDRCVRAGEVLGALNCPSCGLPLVTVATTRSVAFHCQLGHVATPQLLSTQSPVHKQALNELLTGWERAFDDTIDTARDARRRGFPKIAEIFMRQARYMGSRIRTLRAVLGTLRSPGDLLENHHSIDHADGAVEA